MSEETQSSAKISEQVPSERIQVRKHKIAQHLRKASEAEGCTIVDSVGPKIFVVGINTEKIKYSEHTNPWTSNLNFRDA